MWTAMERRRNSFLRKSFADVAPRTVNRMVQECFEETRPESLRGECKELLPQELPVVYCNIPIDVGYGAAGFRKLVQQLGSRYPEIQDAALDVLLGKLANSVLCRKAIQLGIVPKLSEMFLQDRKKVQIIEAWALVASFESGAREISNNESVMSKLMTMLDISSSLFLALALHTSILDHLLDNDYLKLLLPTLETIDARENPSLVKFAARLIDRDPDQAAKDGYFGVLLSKLCTTAPSEVGPWLECCGCLLSTKLVQELADKHFIIHSLNRLLRYWKLPEAAVQYAVLCLQNATISNKAKHQSAELWNLPHLLIELAHNKKDESVQLYAINTLKHLAENLRTRKYMKKVLLQQVLRIYCLNEVNMKAKRKLLAMLRAGCAYLYKH